MGLPTPSASFRAVQGDGLRLGCTSGGGRRLSVEAGSADGRAARRDSGDYAAFVQVATASSLLLQRIAEADLALSFALAGKRSPGQRSAWVGCTLIEAGARATLTSASQSGQNSLVTVMVALLP